MFGTLLRSTGKGKVLIDQGFAASKRQRTCNRSESVMQVRYQLRQRPHYLFFLLRGYLSSARKLRFPLVSNGAVSNAASYEHRGTPTLVVASVALRSDAAGFYGSLHGLAAYPVLPVTTRRQD